MDNFYSEYMVTYLQFFTDQHEYEIRALISFNDSIDGDYNEEYSSLTITYEIEFLSYIDDELDETLWTDYSNHPVYYTTGEYIQVDTVNNGVGYLDLPDLDPQPYLLNYSATLDKDDQEIHFVIYKDGETKAAKYLSANDESDGIAGTYKNNSKEFADVIIQYYQEQAFTQKIHNLIYESAYEEGYDDGRYEGNEVGFNNGYNIGYETGYEEGYELGYDTGRNHGEQVGYNQGYEVGYNQGYELGYDDGEINRPLTTFGTVIKVISDNATNLLNTEILPNFTISNIIFIPVIFSLLGIVFKFFRR